MAAEVRQATGDLIPGSLPEAARLGRFWQDIAARPYAYDLFQTLRMLDAAHPNYPRLGHAPRPTMEPVRVGQLPSVIFAPSTIAAVAPARDGVPPRLRILSFGLFGPNGPMPLSMTEYVHERETQHGDLTLSAFADLFHHRFSMLFYRAWADAQATVSLDQPGADRFTDYVASLLGYGLPAQRQRGVVADHARWHHASHLARPTRNPEGLARILSDYFRTPVIVREYTGKWLHLAAEQFTRLGVRGPGGQLGVGAVAGQAIWDRQHHFTVRLGPMSLDDYQALLPGGARLEQLLDWVRTYIGREFAWDANLVLRSTEIPRTRLGSSQRLGWTSWLGRRPVGQDAEDLIVDVERLATASLEAANKKEEPHG
jgi:type VI secretion system protein ImpH